MSTVPRFRDGGFFYFFVKPLLTFRVKPSGLSGSNLQISFDKITELNIILGHGEAIKDRV